MLKKWIQSPSSPSSAFTSATSTSSPSGNDTDLKTYLNDLLELRTRPYSSAPLLLGTVYAFSKIVLGSKEISQLDDELVNRIKGEMEVAIEGFVAEGNGEMVEGFKRGYERFAKEVCGA
jgi:hypothetical protein